MKLIIDQSEMSAPPAGSKVKRTVTFFNLLYLENKF